MTVVDLPIARVPGPANGRVDVPEVRRLRYDLDRRPFLVLFETTRACDLACTHCRAEAQPACHPDELTTAEVTGVLDDLAAAGPPRPIVVLTGGDPFKRTDLTTLIAHGSAAGLAMAVSPSGTPLATEANLAAVRAAGSGAVSFSLDGPEASSHDTFRGVPGSFALTVDACRAARRVGLRLQVNSTVTAGTVDALPEMARLVRDLDAGLWSVFFLVSTGRGRRLGALDADGIEDVLHLLADVSPHLALKTTEAPQYRRVLHQRAGAGPGGPPAPHGPLYRRLRDRMAAVFEYRRRSPCRARPTGVIRTGVAAPRWPSATGVGSSSSPTSVRSTRRLPAADRRQRARPPPDRHLPLVGRAAGAARP